MNIFPRSLAHITKSTAKAMSLLDRVSNVQLITKTRTFNIMCEQTPSPSHNTSTGSMSLQEGTPVPGPWCLPGVPQSQVRNYPSSRGRGIPVSSRGVPQDSGNPSPQPGQDGVPSPLARTAERVLATQWAVCLWRSRRRTFLFVLRIFAQINLYYFSNGAYY